MIKFFNFGIGIKEECKEYNPNTKYGIWLHRYYEETKITGWFINIGRYKWYVRWNRPGNLPIINTLSKINGK